MTTCPRLLLLFIAGLRLFIDAAPASARRKLDAGHFLVDGIRLGEPFEKSALGARRDAIVSPIAHPPDSSPPAFRVEAFFTSPVHDGLEGTNVRFYVRLDDRAQYDNQAWKRNPVLAVGWVGGTYMNKHSTFPLHVGDRIERADKLLGRPLGRFRVTDPETGMSILVSRHPGDIATLEDGRFIVGFLLGPMEPDSNLVEWRGLAADYEAGRLPGGPQSSPASPDPKRTSVVEGTTSGSR